jgi:hypothetical protein
MTLWHSGETINSIVKRDILLSERGSIPALNDLPGWMIEEAREIARASIVSAVRYLRFYVETQRGSSAEDFIEDVLLKGQDARTWRISDCLCSPWPPTPLAATDTGRYLRVLKDIDGEHWFRLRLKAGDRPSDHSPGMIGVLQRGCRYWSTPPPDTGYYPVTRSDDLESVPTSLLASGIRRWIAHRLAWFARDRWQQSGITAESILHVAFGTEAQRVTPDARIAGEALAREAHAFGDSPSFPQLAGFLGPEEWYQ